MHRRRFLKLMGLASLGATLGVSLPFGAESADAARRVVAQGGKLYRGDRHGRIFVSRNGGATWELHTFLGSHYAIQSMGKDLRGRVRATVGYRGRSFGLFLAPNAQSWMTV